MTRTGRYIISSVTLWLLAAASAGADTVESNPGVITNPLKGDGTLLGLLNTIIDEFLLPVGSILAVVAFIWAGFLFVTAQGNEEKLKTAKRALLYAVIGTAVLLGAKALGTVITNTVGSLQS